MEDRKWKLVAFGGEDAGDAGEVVGYVEIGPLGRFEERADSGKGVVA